ncbi:MAG: hypothetical protein J5661_04715 [Bacteroidaceae bacterium]|nr:hypothetical protein [Bacteroidaceae bacterium]
MKQTKLWMIAAIMTLCGTSLHLSGCKEERVVILPVSGTLEEAFPTDTAPAIVHEAMDYAFMDRYESILNDKENHVSVWSLVHCNPGISSEGYGIIVTKDKESTKLPDIYHGKNPQARYDAQKRVLWLTCDVMEGTGVHVEKLYMLRFSEDNKAHIVSTIDPYDMQQTLCERLGYRIDGERITFYEGERELCVSTNHTTDMGGFDDEQPIWIGEQISYELSGDDPYVRIVPGVKFTTGLVLTYDDMPTFAACVDLQDDASFDIDDLKTVLLDGQN